MEVAAEWFSWELADDGLARIWEPHVHEFMQANMWLVRGREADLLIDAGLGLGDLAGTLRRWGLIGDRPLLLFISHVHADHHGGAHQFWPRVCHPAEAAWLSERSDWHPLVAAEYETDFGDVAASDGAGDDANDGLLISALPAAGFRPREHTVVPAVPTLQLGEGDGIDLGGRRFEVLHLPGHSPGSVALWEEGSATLFAGDVVYDEGPLLDEITGSSVPDYCATMRRLLGLPVRTVFAGHGAPFGRDLLRRRVTDYLRRRDIARHG